MRKLLSISVVLLFIASAAVFAVSSRIGTHSDESPSAEVSPAPEQQAQQVPVRASVTVSAAGDVTLATDDAAKGEGSFESVLADEGYEYFLYHVKEIFEEDDLTIVNFEGTLSDRGTRANKTYAFRGRPEWAQVLTSSSVEAANLANNHSQDYGEDSLADTVSTLNDANILNFYGTNAVIEEINGISVGLCGFNALNETGVEQAPEVVRRLKDEGADLVIASAHWGVEKDTAPSSLQKELAHSMIDAGADLVIGHHPHVLQGIEKYNGGYILYSLGNFCFGGNRNPSDKDTMIFRQTFTFEAGELIDDDNVEIIPCSISSSSTANNYQPIPAVGKQYERITEKITEYTNALGDAAALNFRAEPEV